jgi:hypothetical protein
MLPNSPGPSLEANPFGQGLSGPDANSVEPTPSSGQIDISQQQSVAASLQTTTTVLTGTVMGGVLAAATVRNFQSQSAALNALSNLGPGGTVYYQDVTTTFLSGLLQVDVWYQAHGDQNGHVDYTLVFDPPHA